MRVTALALALGTLCACLGACQGPPLPLANRGVGRHATPQGPFADPSAGRGPAAPLRRVGPPTLATRSRADELAQPFLQRPGEGRESPYNPPVSEAALAEVERAIRLRMRARERVAPDCGMLKRARTLPPPDINGDQQRGGLSVGPIIGFFKWLLEGARIR